MLYIYCWFTSDESVCEFSAMVNDEQRDKSNVECDDGAPLKEWDENERH